MTLINTINNEMKRVILAVLFLMIIGTANVNQNNNINIIKPVKLPLLEYVNKHSDKVYTFKSLDGKISFTHHWCLESGLQKLFEHPLFEKLDKRFLEKFTHIVHTDDLNPKRKVNYIVFGKTNYTYTNYFTVCSINIQINTRVEHFLPIAIEAVIWHEMVHLLLGRGGHCNLYDCPILTKSGDYIELEELIQGFNIESQTKMLEYIIDIQKDWEKI